MRAAFRRHEASWPARCGRAALVCVLVHLAGGATGADVPGPKGFQSRRVASEDASLDGIVVHHVVVDPVQGDGGIMPLLRSSSESVLFADGSKSALREGGAYRWELLGRPDATAITIDLVRPAENPARADAVRAVYDEIWPSLPRVQPLPAPWRLRLVRHDSTPVFSRWGLRVAETEFTPEPGKETQTVSLPLTDPARARLRDESGGRLCLEVSYPYAAAWSPRDVEEIGRTARLIPFVNSRLTIDPTSDVSVALERLQTAVRDSQHDQWLRVGVDPSWGFESVTKPALRALLLELSAKDVGWKDDVTVLLHPRVAWFGSPSLLRTIAKDQAAAARAIGPALERLGGSAAGGRDPGPKWALVHVREPGSLAAPGEWWSSLSTDVRAKVVKDCAAALALAAKLPEKPQTKVAVLGYWTHDDPGGVDVKSLRSGAAWHPQPLFGTPYDELASLGGR
jgi:hypothetical protein